MIRRAYHWWFDHYPAHISLMTLFILVGVLALALGSARLGEGITLGGVYGTMFIDLLWIIAIGSRQRWPERKHWWQRLFDVFSFRRD